MKSYEMCEFFYTESEYQGTSSKKTAKQINSFQSNNINIEQQTFDEFLDDRIKVLDKISKNISNTSSYYRPNSIPNHRTPPNEYRKTKVNSSTYKYEKVIPPYETFSKDDFSKIVANITQFLGYNQ